MEIRRADEDEAAALTALACVSKAHWPYPAEQIEAWRSDLTISAEQIAAHPTFVAEAGGEIAGFYQLLAEQVTWVLEHLWVLPEHRGKGVGRTLIQHAMNMARERGANGISIDADPYAEAFYKACGAETIGAKAAPLEDMPNRVRPQMILRL